MTNRNVPQLKVLNIVFTIVLVGCLMTYLLLSVLGRTNACFVGIQTQNTANKSPKIDSFLNYHT